MTAQPAAGALRREPGAPSFLTEGGTTVRSWLLSTDHKRVAFLYAAGITFFFFLGGSAAVMIRANLVTPAGFLTADEYNRLFTLHGVVMVWFFLVPAIPTTLGNFLLPLVIGAREVAFPRLNLFSWYLYLGGGLLTVLSLILGGVDTGWTFYTPFSTLYSNSYVLLAAAGVFVVGFSSIATGINFIATIHLLRARGMTWMRLPLFAWAMYTTSLVMVLATPVLAISLLLIFAERAFGLPIFDPRAGGDPILFQHLFWFYSHPAVYIMILPAFGVVSEIIACEARRRVFGYQFMVYAMVAIAILGFMVWGHHMFVSGQSPFANLVFSFLSFVVAVPSAIKVFNWTGTLYRGQIRFSAPMLYALGFVGLFTLGGLTGLFLASVPIDVHVTDTYFVTAHFHYIMVGGSVSAFFGGLHFWWPKITGRMYSEGLAKFAAISMFFGFNFTFFPQFVLGWLGMPRRYHSYPPEFQAWHVMSSTGAVVLAFAYLWPLFYLGWSLVKGERAGDNPHDATGLEWQTSSPPPKDNFAVPPIVTDEPYRYHPEGYAPHDVEQTPLGAGPMTDTALQEPWATPERQRVAVQFGMWSFLATETLFFGGLMLVYAVARFRHPAGFVAGARETEVLLGSVNTVTLLTSSLTMAIAERATREALVSLARAMFAATWLLGAAFLVVKGFEYHSDIAKRLLPGSDFPLHQTGAAQFWAFYWTATGIHAAHLAIGLGVVGRMLLIPRGELAARATAAEGSALYWHFVDMIWVLLFALLYLVGR